MNAILFSNGALILVPSHWRKSDVHCRAYHHRGRSRVSGDADDADEADIITTVAIGIAGALIGGLVLRTLLAVMGMLSGLVGAVLGALLLIWLWQKYLQK